MEPGSANTGMKAHSVAVESNRTLRRTSSNTVVSSPENTEKVRVTDPTLIPSEISSLRRFFDSGATRPLAWRKEQLKKLLTLINEGRSELETALQRDLHKDAVSSWVTEISLVRNEVVDMIDHLEKYAKPRSVATNLLNAPGWSQINSDPLGVILVVGCWNYPVNLSLMPLAGAIAAGNTVALRLPSDNYAPHTAATIQRLVERYLDPSYIRCFKGDRTVMTALLEERYDKIMFTGGTYVGKIVAAAAAKHLTPVLLELGGKSPVIVDCTADIGLTARRIVWASFLNSGQTCVRPDYCIVDASVARKLKTALKNELVKQFGENPKGAAEFGRIVNARAHGRLSTLIDDCKDRIVHGGERDSSDLYIAPTLLDYQEDTKSFWASPAMKDEIFGPILPILATNNMEKELQRIRSREKPLAFYCFTRNKSMRRTIQDTTTSGSLVFNDAVLQLSNDALPFSGVGGSGMGAYHGRHSFDTFSHQRAVMFKTGWLDLWARYPPFNSTKKRVLELALSPRPHCVFGHIQETLVWGSLVILLIIGVILALSLSLA